jgi:hypothetical protein
MRQEQEQEQKQQQGLVRQKQQVEQQALLEDFGPLRAPLK